MSQPYRDVFGNKLSKKDVTLSTHALLGRKKLSPIQLHRLTRLGIGKSNRIYRLLQDANIVSADQQVILTGAPAENAALRQLKKGRG